ncbi:hypothetical protein TIFTF001_025331 [Ficus carica]|uniref:Uncharacterized protein n=1 Tax=Ficus carica TaxID=3494 RepID=A0AA88DH79_FICCA|nr:hypothetical protein TIFTF001_025331 [Ficus carica]
MVHIAMDTLQAAYRDEDGKPVIDDAMTTNTAYEHNAAATGFFSVPLLQ